MAALLGKYKQLKKALLVIRQLSSNSNSMKSFEFFPHKQAAKRTYALKLPRYLTTVAHEYENHYDQSKFSNSTSDDIDVETLLLKMDAEVKRFGQINRFELLRILEQIKKSGNVSSIQSLYLLHYCGSLLSYEIPQYRNEIIHKIWNTLQDLGVPLDASHYNALLKAYLENNYPFIPSEFLALMESKGVLPDRVTYQRIIQKYCMDGDLTGASAILEYMKKNDMVISEQVFNSLILGHARAKDMDGAINLLEVMREKFQLGLSAETYIALACGYAENGNVDQFKRTLQEAEENQQYFSNQKLIQMLPSVAASGDFNCIDLIFEKIDPSKYKSGCFDAVTMMTDKGLEDVAYRLLTLVATPNFTIPTANFVNALIMKDKPLEIVLKYCEDIFNKGLHDGIYISAVKHALLLKKREYAMKFFEEMKGQGMELRHHFFWPILAQCRDEKKEQDIWSTLHSMTEMGVPADRETYLTYVLPGISVTPTNELIDKIKKTGQAEECFTDSLFLYCLSSNKELALDILSSCEVHANISSVIYFILENVKEDVNFVLQILTRFNSEETSSEDNNIFGLFLEKLIHRFPYDAPLFEKYLKEYDLKKIYLPQRFVRSIGDKLNVLAPELVGSLNHLNVKAFVSQGHDLTHPMNQNLSELEKRLEDANEKGENIRPILRHLLSLYCRAKMPDQVLKMKAELDKINYLYSPSTYAMLINHFVQFDKLEEANKCMKSIEEQYPHFQLDAAKVIDYANVLLKNGKTTDALRVIQTVAADGLIPENLEFLYISVSKLLNTASEKGDVELTKKLFDLLVHDLKLVNPEIQVVSPLINAHLNSGNFDSAIEEYRDCVQKYKCFPCKYQLFSLFISRKDTERLQKVVDLSNSRNGKRIALHDLACAFIENGCIQEAHRVIQTLGINADMQILDILCKRLRKFGKVTELEKFISITRDLVHIDRDRLYSHLLDIYDQENKYQLALEMWNTMQEENVKPSFDTLDRLEKLLKKNNQSVPFISPLLPTGNATTEFHNLIQEKKEIEVLRILNSMKKGEIHSFKSKDFSDIVDLLVEKHCLKDLLNIVQVMSCILAKPAEIMKPVFKKYADVGDTESVKELYSFLPEFAHKFVSCNFYYFEAHLVSGKAEELLSVLGENVKLSRKMFSGKKFLQLLANHPELEDKASLLADEYEKEHFDIPKVMLWLHYFLHEQYEKADEIFKMKSKFILAKENPFVEIMKCVRQKNNETMGRKLVDLANISLRTNIKARAYSCLLDVLVNESKLEEALALVEEAKMFDISTTQFLNPSLMNLKKSLLEKNMAVPVEILVEETLVNSSSSSDDSE